MKKLFALLLLCGLAVQAFGAKQASGYKIDIKDIKVKHSKFEAKDVEILPPPTGKLCPTFIFKKGLKKWNLTTCKKGEHDVKIKFPKNRPLFRRCFKPIIDPKGYIYLHIAPHIGPESGCASHRATGTPKSHKD